MPIAYHVGLSMYKVLLDSERYLLSYSRFKYPLEPDVHHMTSQILSLKDACDRQSLIDKQNFADANCISCWTFNVQSFA